LRNLEINFTWGNVVRKLARELLDRYPSRFTEDFETNKKLIAELTSLGSKKLRNRLAGLIIKEIARSKKKYS